MGDTNIFPSGMSEAARIAAQASQDAQNGQNVATREAGRGAEGRRIVGRPTPRGRAGTTHGGDPRSAGARRDSNRATRGVPNPTPHIAPNGGKVDTGNLTPAQRERLEQQMRRAPEQPYQQPQTLPE